MVRVRSIIRLIVAASGWAAVPLHAASLTVTVTNLPAWSEYADGQVLALVGTFNSWNNTANLATVNQQRVSFFLPDLGSPAGLGTGWGDLLGGENVAFQVVKPGIWTSLVKTDFLTNEGNFRLPVPGGTPTLVEINAGPVPTILDQDSAVAVNGVRAVTPHPVDALHFTYPEGRWKALVMSYDDGHVQDRGLVDVFNRHGIKGTFHLNSGWFDQNTFVTAAEIPNLYAGHEVSIHTVDHPDLTTVGDGTVEWEVGHCRYVIGGLVGHEVNSMSYPFGTYDRRVIGLTAGQGVTSSRSVLRAPMLDYFPAHYLKWHPTCHHADADWFADQFLARTEERLALLFIWGHSYELDQTYANNSWAYMEALAAKLGDRGDTWYCGQGELRDYLVALQGATLTSNRVSNPSGITTVWAKLADRVVLVRPGRTLAYPAGRVTLRPSSWREGDTVSITYDPAGNGLAGSTSLWLHVGVDGWQQARDVVMTNDGTAWSAALQLSNGVRSVAWIFRNEDGVLDDGFGRDWQAVVRPQGTGIPARIQAVPGHPAGVQKNGAGQNGVGERMDVSPAGGALAVTPQGGFGRLDRLLVNVDDEYLYVGGDRMDPGGNNNGFILFLSVDTLPDGVSNLWGMRGAPSALEALHNLAFSPAVNLAVVLGDEFGDGTFAHFNFGNGYDFGQGVYRLSTNASYFVPVRGARLNQFDGTGTVATVTEDDDGDRLANRFVAAIPWASLNAPLGVRSLGRLHVSGVWVSDGVVGSDRFVSGNYLGSSAVGTLSGGNFGLNFVQLFGERVGLPDEDSDGDGQPDGWCQQHFGHPLGEAGDGSRAQDDGDGDGLANGDEFGAGTDPTNRASVFTLLPSAAGGLNFAAVSGRTYRVSYTTNLLSPSDWSLGAGSFRGTGGVMQVGIPENFPNVSYRVEVLPP